MKAYLMAVLVYEANDLIQELENPFNYSDTPMAEVNRILGTNFKELKKN